MFGNLAADGRVMGAVASIGAVAAASWLQGGYSSHGLKAVAIQFKKAKAKAKAKANFVPRLKSRGNSMVKAKQDVVLFNLILLQMLRLESRGNSMVMAKRDVVLFNLILLIFVIKTTCRI